MRERVSRGAVLVVLGLVALFALVIRWGWLTSRDGPELRPRPDVVEYVAGAQAIAQEGRYFLQIGADRYPPRYAPGWSLVYAAALRAGVASDQLWRLTSAADVASLVGLAALAAALVSRSLGRDHPATRWAPALAALLCGFLLAATSGRIRIALTGLAEPPALAFALGALALAARGLLGADPPAARRAMLVAAGALGLLATAIRPMDGAAAAAACLALVGWAMRRRGLAATARRLVWPVLGALAVASLIGAVLVRSDRPPLQWTAYSVWIPAYASVGRWLKPEYALARGLRVAARVLSGDPFAPKRPNRMIAGLPLAALALLGLAITRRRGPPPRDALPTAVLDGLAFTLAVWFAAHTLAYAAYAFRMVRYFYAPGALLALAGAWGAAVVAARGPRIARAAAVLLVGWSLWIAAADLTLVGRKRPYEPRKSHRERVEAAVQHWQRLPPRRREGRRLPFDPVEAQAYGLFATARAARLDWGASLPRTAQTVRLGAAKRALAAATDSVDTPGDGP